MKNYEIIDDTLIFADGEIDREADVSEVIDNLVSTTGRPTMCKNGRLFEQAEYAYDCPVDGEGQTGLDWFECDLSDIERAVSMSNYKILVS